MNPNVMLGVFLASEEGGKIQAHHPMLPETKEIIGGGLAFLLVVILLVWKAGPLAKKAMAERTERIRVEVEGAEMRRNEAQKALDETKQKLANIDEEAAAIVAEARASAESLRKTLTEQGAAELAAYRERTKAELAAAHDRVLADINAEATALAVDLAEKVVKHTLDASTQKQLVNNYIAELTNA